MSAASPPAHQPALIRQIYKQAPNERVRIAELFGALLEGGSWSGPWGLGDGGTSGGPFQIHWTVHPQVVADAQARGVTPAQLVANPKYAVDFMTGQYVAAVNQVPDSLWQSDPERAAEQAVFLAEKPYEDYYSAFGAATVHAKWQRVEAFLGSGHVPAAGGGGGGGGAGSSGGSGSTTQPDSSGGSSSAPASFKLCIPGTSACFDTHVPTPSDVFGDLGKLSHLVGRIALGILGGLIILLGIYVTVKGQPPSLPGMPGGGGGAAGEAGAAEAAETAAVAAV